MCIEQHLEELLHEVGAPFDVFVGRYVFFTAITGENNVSDLCSFFFELPVNGFVSFFYFYGVVRKAT